MLGGPVSTAADFSPATEPRHLSCVAAERLIGFSWAAVVNAWQDHRNKHHAKANWQFKTADARVKLKRLYPQFG